MYVNRSRIVVAAIAAFLALCTEKPAPATEMIPVGVAKVDITPEYPVRMYGYASRKAESQGIAGRLKAAALVLGGDEGEGPAVLLTVDCGAVPADLLRSARVSDVSRSCYNDHFLWLFIQRHRLPVAYDLFAING